MSAVTNGIEVELVSASIFPQYPCIFRTHITNPELATSFSNVFVRTGKDFNIQSTFIAHFDRRFLGRSELGPQCGSLMENRICGLQLRVRVKANKVIRLSHQRGILAGFCLLSWLSPVRILCRPTLPSRTGPVRSTILTMKCRLLAQRHFKESVSRTRSPLVLDGTCG